MAPGEKARESPWVGSCGEPCGRDSLHHFKFPNKEAQGHRAQPLLQISAGRRLLLGPNFRFLCGDSTLMIFIWTPGQPAPGHSFQLPLLLNGTVIQLPLLPSGGTGE